MSNTSKGFISRRNRRVKALGPDVPPVMALDTSCLLSRPPRCRRCSRTMTSGRRLTSRPTLNGLSRHSSALRCLRQSCGQLPRLLAQSCLIGSASATPAPDALSSPPPPLSSPRRWWWSQPPLFLPPPHDCGLHGSDCRCVPDFPDFILPTLPPGFGQKTGSGSSIVGHEKGLGEGKGRGGSRLSGIERTIHAKPYLNSTATAQNTPKKSEGAFSEQQLQLVHVFILIVYRFHVKSCHG